MKYFFDTEFIEGFKKPISWLPTIGNFNKPYHSIQLISIGVVAEDGREYYATSNEFNPDDANDWVKENVLKPLETEMAQKEHYAKQYHPALLNLKTLMRWQGKSNNRIAADIIDFIGLWKGDMAKTTLPSGFIQFNMVGGDAPEFYAYYSDYDWVVFCSLFGTMMDLPKGFPMYCKDLKQTFDETLDSKVFVEKWMDGRPR